MAHPNDSAMTLEDLEDRPVGLYNRNVAGRAGSVAGPSSVQGRGCGAPPVPDSGMQMRSRLRREYDAWYGNFLEQSKQQHEALVQGRYQAEVLVARRADESRYNKRVAGTEQNMHIAYDRDMARERQQLCEQMEAEWAHREAVIDQEDIQADGE